MPTHDITTSMTPFSAMVHVKRLRRVSVLMGEPERSHVDEDVNLTRYRIQIGYQVVSGNRR
jgi:hypothetical protein